MAGSYDIQWGFSQVKGTLEDEVTKADIISCVEFNQDGDLLATSGKSGQVGKHNVCSTFQRHEPEFDDLVSILT